MSPEAYNTYLIEYAKIAMEALIKNAGPLGMIHQSSSPDHVALMSFSIAAAMIKRFEKDGKR